MSPREAENHMCLPHVESSESFSSLHVIENVKHESLSDAVRKSVSFSSVTVREYNRVLGDHPDVRVGPPVALGWEYNILPEQTVDDYEESRPGRRKRFLRMSSITRKHLLVNEFGVTEEEIRGAEDAVRKVVKQRDQTIKQSKTGQKFEGAVRSARRKLRRSFSGDLFFRGLSAASGFAVPLGAM